MLTKIFPECDGQCKNPDRMFFGGKELIYVNSEARIALVQLHSSVSLCQMQGPIPMENSLTLTPQSRAARK